MSLLRVGQAPMIVLQGAPILTASRLQKTVSKDRESPVLGKGTGISARGCQR